MYQEDAMWRKLRLVKPDPIALEISHLLRKELDLIIEPLVRPSLYEQWRRSPEGVVQWRDEGLRLPGKIITLWNVRVRPPF